MATKKPVKKPARAPTKTVARAPAKPAKAAKALAKPAKAPARPAKTPATEATLARAAGAGRDRAAREGATVIAAVGSRAPRFSLIDDRGERLDSAALAGQAYVLYFYPRDNTPGCTREAQGFRDAARDLAALGVRVIGVSPDPTASHARFRDQHGLDFALLSDPERSVARSFGVFGPKRMMGRETIGIVRSTFLIDGGGRIRRAWRGVRVDGHVAEVLAAAREL